MKKLVSFLFILIVLVFNTSYCKFNWVGLDLSTTDITNCINFQLTRGGSSIADFEKITNILNKFISQKYPKERLIEVLGVPNVSVDNCTSVYYLSDNPAGKKAILKTDKGVLVSYTIVER